MTGRFNNERSQAAIERFTEIARDCGHELATFATAWTLSRDFVASTLIGATTADQLADTLAAAGVTLPDEALAACDAISREILYPLG